MTIFTTQISLRHQTLHTSRLFKYIKHHNKQSCTERSSLHLSIVSVTPSPCHHVTTYTGLSKCVFEFDIQNVSLLPTLFRSLPRILPCMTSTEGTLVGMWIVLWLLLFGMGGAQICHEQQNKLHYSRLFDIKGTAPSSPSEPI